MDTLDWLVTVTAAITIPATLRMIARRGENADCDERDAERVREHEARTLTPFPNHDASTVRAVANDNGRAKLRRTA